jgi:hypothetical protein
LPPEELDSLEGSLPLEAVLVDVSELTLGVLFSVVLPVEALDDWELEGTTVFFVERAGSWPDASCT